jgi:hypothetical protein
MHATLPDDFFQFADFICANGYGDTKFTETTFLAATM